MGAGVVTVGRTPYAVGLYWENSTGERVSQTAKEAARQPGQQAEFYAVRPGNKNGRIAQFGLGQAASGHKSGMPVFAACLANQQPGSWAGAFRLREGTVIIIVRDDLIVPDGDLFFLDENEARDRLLQEIGFGGLQRIYAPENWAISNADTMPISLLLDERKDIRLANVEIPRKMLMFGGGGVAVLLLILGGGWYYQNMKAEEEAKRAAQMAAMERARKAAENLLPQQLQQEAPVYPPPERKWENKPSALVVIDACRAGLSGVPAAVLGWKMGSLKCDGASLLMTWTRSRGFTVPLKLPGITSVITVNESGSAATTTVPLKALPPRGHEDLMDPMDLTNRYIMQDWPGTLGRAQDDPPPPPPVPYNYKGAWTPPPPPWIKRSFTFSVSDLPSYLPTLIGDVPGVVVNSLAYSGTGWTIEGVIYENRI